VIPIGSETHRIVWLRDDLRISDDPALHAALKTGAPCATRPAMPHGGAARWWLAQSLKSVQTNLRSAGTALILRRGPAATWVAGSGADAAPYFQVFNPVLQGGTFDPDGAYVPAMGAGAGAAAGARFMGHERRAARAQERGRGTRLHLSRADHRPQHKAGRECALAACAKLRAKQ
jgi:DNA photolyase/DNA photolyase-like FAD binding protein